jgi:hypothetical protein
MAQEGPLRYQQIGSDGLGKATRELGRLGVIGPSEQGSANEKPVGRLRERGRKSAAPSYDGCAPMYDHLAE